MYQQWVLLKQFLAGLDSLEGAGSDEAPRGLTRWEVLQIVRYRQPQVYDLKHVLRNLNTVKLILGRLASLAGAGSESGRGAIFKLFIEHSFLNASEELSYSQVLNYMKRFLHTRLIIKQWQLQKWGVNGIQKKRYGDFKGLTLKPMRVNHTAIRSTFQGSLRQRQFEFVRRRRLVRRLPLQVGPRFTKQKTTVGGPFRNLGGLRALLRMRHRHR